jgi:hypothetical protein
MTTPVPIVAIGSPEPAEVHDNNLFTPQKTARLLCPRLRSRHPTPARFRNARRVGRESRRGWIRSFSGAGSGEGAVAAY